MAYGDKNQIEPIGGPHCYTYVCAVCGTPVYPPRREDTETWCEHCGAWRMSDVKWNCLEIKR